MSEDRIEVRLTLEGPMATRFTQLKNRYGFESNTDLLRLLITNAHEEMTNTRKPLSVRDDLSTRADSH